MGSEDLNARVDMAELLVDVGFSDVDPDAEEQLLFCVFHNDSGTRSFSVNLTKKVFHCFSSACGVKGSAITLYALWKQISYEEAKREIAYLPVRRSVDRLQQMLRAAKVPMPVSRRMDILTAFTNSMPMLVDTEHADLLRRRSITDDTMRRYGFRAYDESKVGQFDPKDLFEAGLANVWLRPIYGAHPMLFPFTLRGRVAFLQGRAVVDDPTRSKYMGCRGTVPCLFNHDKLLDVPEQVFVTEGVVDAISMEQMGYGPAVGIVGTEGFKPDWAADFKGVKEIWLAMDNDPAGDAAVEKIASMLVPTGAKIMRFAFDRQHKDVNAWLCAMRRNA